MPGPNVNVNSETVFLSPELRKVRRFIQALLEVRENWRRANYLDAEWTIYLPKNEDTLPLENGVLLGVPVMLIDGLDKAIVGFELAEREMPDVPALTFFSRSPGKLW